jgi:hypothetical protein
MDQGKGLGRREKKKKSQERLWRAKKKGIRESFKRRDLKKRNQRKSCQ